jgi:hypothetical protein
MKNIFQFALVGIVLGGALLLLSIGVAKTTKNWEQGMNAQKRINIPTYPYSPDDFKENYRVDLKPDGYLIVDSYDGECYFVPFGGLEDWFNEMNL